LNKETGTELSVTTMKLEKQKNCCNKVSPLGKTLKTQLSTEFFKTLTLQKKINSRI